MGQAESDSVEDAGVSKVSVPVYTGVPLGLAGYEGSSVGVEATNSDVRADVCDAKDDSSGSSGDCEAADVVISVSMPIEEVVLLDVIELMSMVDISPMPVLGMSMVGDWPPGLLEDMPSIVVLDCMSPVSVDEVISPITLLVGMLSIILLDMSAI